MNRDAAFDANLSAIPGVDGEPAPTNGHAHASATLISPGLLAPSKAAPAYEMKFLIDAAIAAEIRAWACRHLTVDPHAAALGGDAYSVRSLYLDTDTLDVLHRSPSYRRRKYRLRRYGGAPDIFLERKSRSGDRVAKRRSEVSQDEVNRLLSPVFDPAWAGFWFQRKLIERGLKPRCLVGYERIAYVGQAADGPIRLTLDSRVCSRLTDRWDLNEIDDGVPLLTDRVILELKFRMTMPMLFKTLVLDTGLHPGRASKYRLGMAAHGLATNVRT